VAINFSVVILNLSELLSLLGKTIIVG